LSAGVTTPLVALTSNILSTAGAFEASMNQVMALTGATGATFDSMRAQAMELGRTTQFSASQAADAMGFLGMAGFDAQEIMAAMPNVLQLAAAANIDLGRAADITSNILSGYAMETSQLAYVNDVLVKAMTSSNVNMEMLGASMKYAGPIAAGLGLDFAEVTAAIGMMGDAGIQGEQAGTALRGALARLVKPTNEVQGALDGLGVAVTDSQGELLPLVDIFRQLEDAGATTTDMISIFGIEAGPAMISLLSMGSEALNQFTGELQNAGGTAEEISAVQMKGFQGAIKALQSAWEGLLITFADSGLLDVAAGMIVDATAFLGDLTTSLADVSPEAIRMAVTIAGIAAAAGPVLGVLAGVTAALGFLLSPLGAVVVGVAALAAAFALDFGGIRTVTSQVVNELVGLFGELRAAGGSSLEALSVVREWPGPLRSLGEAAVGAGASLQAIWEVASGGKVDLSELGRLSTIIDEAFGPGSVQTVMGFGMSLREMSAGAQEAWGKLTDFLSPAGDRLRDSLSTAFSGLSELGPKFGAMATAAGPALERIGQTAQAVGAALVVVFDFAINAVGSILNRLPAIAGFALDQIVAMITLLSSTLDGLFKLVGALINGDWKGAWAAAQQIYTGFDQFLRSSLTNLTGLAGEVYGALRDTIVNTLSDMGIDVAAGVAEAEAIVTRFWNWLTGLSGAEIFAGISTGFAGAVETMIGWVWPEPADLLGWRWPEPSDLLNWGWPDLSDLLDWSWPDLYDLKTYRWPEVPRPDWLENLLSWRPSIPGFATGTRSAPGGLAWVGERGPELVRLPRGSQVWSNRESMQMAGAASGGVHITINATGSGPEEAEALAYRVINILRRKGV
jgi:TP901 family phage tail tape measure protein